MGKLYLFTSKGKDGRKGNGEGRGRKGYKGKEMKGVRGEVEGDGVDIAWSDH